MTYYWPWVSDFEAIVFAVCALPVCFFGKRLSWLSILVVFYMVSCYCAASAGENLTLSPGNKLAVQWVIFGVGMLIGVLVAFCLLTVSVIIIGAAAAGLLGNLAYQLILSAGVPDIPYVRLAVIIITALCGAFIAYKALKTVLKLVTPVLGAYLLVAAIDHLGYVMEWWDQQPFFPLPDPVGQFFSHPEEFPWDDGKHSFGLLVAWIVLAVCGLLVQFCCGSKQKEQPVYHEEGVALVTR